jgi:hypothetical protein
VKHESSSIYQSQVISKVKVCWRTDRQMDRQSDYYMALAISGALIIGQGSLHNMPIYTMWSFFVPGFIEITLKGLVGVVKTKYFSKKRQSPVAFLDMAPLTICTSTQCDHPWYQVLSKSSKGFKSSWEDILFFKDKAIIGLKSWGRNSLNFFLTKGPL